MHSQEFEKWDSKHAVEKKAPLPTVMWVILVNWNNNLLQRLLLGVSSVLP